MSEPSVRSATAPTRRAGLTSLGRYRLTTVGTAKRERQKANKARREQEAVREQTKKRTIRLSVLIGGAIIAVFVIVAVAGRFFLDSEDDNDPIAPVDTAPTTEVASEDPAESDET